MGKCRIQTLDILYEGIIAHLKSLMMVLSSVQSLSCDCSTPGIPVHHQLLETTQNSCPLSR